MISGSFFPSCSVLASLAALVVIAASLVGCGSNPKPSPEPSPSADKSVVTLSNGVSMPLLAAGTWQYNDTVAAEEVVAALRAGFKHIDTAYDYGNQVGVGKGLLDSGVKRSDVFITTKVPGCGIQGLGKENCYNNTLNAIKSDLTQLGSAGFPIAYLDLLLIHFPPCMQATGKEKSPTDTVCSKRRTGCTNQQNCEAIAEQWVAVQDMYKKKLVRAVGVSNYCSACFKCFNSQLKPMVNQVQMHVGMGPDPQGFVSFAKKNDMVLQAWSPLGSGGHGSSEILSGELTKGIAKAHGKSTAQVALKWLVTLGASVATKSDNPKHLEEDIALFDWDFTAAEMTSLNAADFAKNNTPSFLCDDVSPHVPEEPTVFA